MSRRKHLASRQPDGSIRNAEQTPHAEIRRLREAGIRDARQAEWGTALGWLVLTRKITDAQYVTGKRWRDLCLDYTATMAGPKAPRSVKLDPEGGVSPDVDSATGRREAQRHTQTVHRWLGATEVLKLTGQPVRLALRHVCELNIYIDGQKELMDLKHGLDVLAAWWAGGVTKPARSGPKRTDGEHL
jgi:hypothetical protein